MTLAAVRRPTCEARSAARKASPITYTPPWKYRTIWRGSIPSTVISAVGTPPSAAVVTVTSTGSGCADVNSRSSRRCSLTSVSTGKADCRRIASMFSRWSVLTAGRCRPLGVHLRAVAEVEPDRFHHPERGALGKNVRGRQHARVLLDVARRVDGVDRLPRALGDVGHVLLMEGDVLARAKPAEVAADEVLPRVRQGVRRRLDVAGDVLGQVGDVHRCPAGVHDVDQHQRVVVGQVDDDVVRRVVGAVPGQVDALAADLECAAVPERLLRRGPRGIVVAQQESSSLLVPDARDVLVEEERRAGVVGVVMGVDEVLDLVADAVRSCDLVDGPLDVVADRRWRVEHDDAVRGREKCGLVRAVGAPVEVSLETTDVVALLVQRGAERRLRNRRVIRKVCAHVGTSTIAVVMAGMVASQPRNRIREIRSHAACGELRGLRPSRPHPAAATPSPTKIAKPSTVSGALAPWSSATPAPMTGTESPTKSAISNSAVIATRFSGAVPSSTRPVVPL